MASVAILGGLVHNPAMPRSVRIGLLAVLAAWPATAVAQQPPQQLSNSAFQIQYDENGIRSLKRTNDVADTDYIAANGSLGRLVIRYRTARNGDWREMREMRLGGNRTATSLAYEFGSRLPTLAARSTGGAAVGAAGVRALNDGVVPIPASNTGRAGGAGGRAGGPPPADVPLFTWAGSRGATQWVQYTFPGEESVSRAEVFWTTPPTSWRMLYQDGAAWKEVAARGSYGVAADTFTAVEFAPVKTSSMRLEVTMAPTANVALAEWRVGPEPELAPPSDLHVSQSFALDGDTLAWTISLANAGSRQVEIGDLAVPFNFAERAGARGDIYTRKVMRHSLVAGHGSWIYWQRSNGEGPYLVMTPAGGTKLEYFDSTSGAFTPYIHAKAASAAVTAAGGNWRLPVTSLTLAPKGSTGSSATYTFRFRWARDFAGVRDALYEGGVFDTRVVPGMVVPSDLSAMFSLRTKNTIASIAPEHPASTTVSLVSTRLDGTKVYRATFSRLGENMLTIRYGTGQWASLEFFVTEPLETVIQKRAAFLVSHHQHTDPSKWYYGVYGEWDQKNEILRGPEDRDNLSAWLTDANDDAGNARPAFIAAKNVFFPNQTEIDSLEIYISKYLWGGMQMTDREKYPYAIYGIQNWKANRASPDEGRNGQAHVWRIYDYPHIIHLYYRMYQIAKFYPAKSKYLNAAGYLERAYRTAVAYWTVPLAVEKWSADAVGTMNEAFIPDLIQALEDEGHADWASTVRGHWEGKVDRFVNRTPNLYGSEFAFDSTGFESTGAFARYALMRGGTPAAPSRDAAAAEFRRKVPYDASLKFMNFQMLLNMSDRGWLEPTYYQLGTDYRGGMTYLLSYMSHLGGWSILDYGLHFASNPADYLQLGYASSLSAWALVNSGTAQSGYGYWFPGQNNDGATGGGFMPEAMGRAWIGKTMSRGAWHYSAEEDVGYVGALRTHATILTRDPNFGEFAYGGIVTRAGSLAQVVPRDGLRVRFHVIRDGQRLHMELDHDGYAKERPIVVADDLSSVRFVVENRAGGAHQTTLSIDGLPPGEYRVMVAGASAGVVSGGGPRTITLPVAATATTDVVISKSGR
jgi:hypothetical protein